MILQTDVMLIFILLTLALRKKIGKKMPRFFFPDRRLKLQKKY